MGRSDKLTVKQEKFSQFYVKDGVAYKAYTDAGYKASSKEIAHAESSKLLQNPKVSARIKELMDLMQCERIASAEEVLSYLTSVMRGDVKEEVVSIYDGITSRANKESDVRDRNKAAELLGKRYRLFVDKIEAEVDTEIVVKMDQDAEDWSK